MILLQRDLGFPYRAQKTPVGVEPTLTGLQPVAWPSGSSVIKQMSPPGIEPGPRPSQGRMRIRHTPRTFGQMSPPPGNRTRPCGFEDRRAPDTLAGSERAIALARSRTWSATFGGSCAHPSHSKGFFAMACSEGFYAVLRIPWISTVRHFVIVFVEFGN